LIFSTSFFHIVNTNILIELTLYPTFDSWPNDVLFTRKISKIVKIEFDSWVIFMGKI